MEAVDRNLAAQLDQQINPPLIVLPLPWEPTTTTTTTTEAPITTTTTTTETPVTTSTTTTEETTLA
jgi:mRNA-degrading endonuclease toxin of MazEF toxin-antitoxin module